MKGSISRFLSGLLGNKGIKIIALLLGVITWYAIREEISFEKDVTGIPIRILVDDGYALFDLDPTEATVRLQGPEDAVWNLNRENVRIQLDIRGRSSEGTLRIPLEPAHVQTPGGVRTADIRPSRVFLSVDQVAETNVLVRADVEGELPQGFEVEAVVTRPATVRLRGPRQGLSEIKEISTAPIDLAGRLGSFELPVTLETPRVTWEARVDPTFVNVAVTVVERSATRSLDDIPVRVVIGSGRAVDISPLPDVVRVEVAGRTEKLDALDPEAVFAYVDCGGLNAGGSYELPVQVHVPGNLTVQEINPLSVKVTLGTL